MLVLPRADWLKDWSSELAVTLGGMGKLGREIEPNEFKLAHSSHWSHWSTLDRTNVKLSPWTIEEQEHSRLLLV